MKYSRPKRILQMAVSNKKGGLTAYICQNYRFLNKEKLQFDFITYEDKLDFQEEFENMGAKFYKLPKPMHFFSYLKALRIIQNEQDYKIVHCNLSYFNFIAVLAYKLVGIENIIIHSHSTQIDDKRKLVRFIKTCIHKAGKIFMEKISTDYLACSEKAALWMFNSDIISSKKYRIANNAIDVEKFLYSQEKRKLVRYNLGIDDREFVVGHIGRFTYQKNHEFLIKVFQEILKIENNSRLLLVGDGDDRENIEVQARKIGVIDKIIFLGLRNDVPDLMQAMDCFVLPSHFEGLPLVAVEAQAAGLKSYLSDVITNEVKITDLVNFISLQQEPKYWAQRILEGRNYERKDMSREIKAAGYDIKSEIGKIEKFYLER